MQLGPQINLTCEARFPLQEGTEGVGTNKKAAKSM